MSDRIKFARAQSTGTLVEVWRPLSISDDPGWVTVCEHSSICHHETRALAISFSAAPEEWCETGCRHAAEGKRCLGCGSTRMDFHGDMWSCAGCGDEWACYCSEQDPHRGD